MVSLQKFPHCLFARIVTNACLMAKVELELVRRIVQRNTTDPKLISQIMNELTQEIAFMEDDLVDTPPPVKKQWVVVVSDPNQELKDKDFVAWVAQIQEDESPFTIEEKLFRSGYAYNTTKRGRRIPARTIQEVCEFVPAKILKEQAVWLKTKEPVLVVRTDNIIPTEVRRHKNDIRNE